MCQEVQKEITGITTQGIHQGPTSSVFLLSGPMGRRPAIAVTRWSWPFLHLVQDRGGDEGLKATCLFHRTFVSQHFTLKCLTYGEVESILQEAFAYPTPRLYP